MSNKIVVNSNELAEYLNGFLLHSRIGNKYDMVIKGGWLYVPGHINNEKVKVRPVAAEYSQQWPYQRFARLAVIVGSVEDQDVVFNLETLSICVIL